MTMTTPFDSGSLGCLEMKNRFVRSATWEGMAETDGSCPAPLNDLVKELAIGEVGLIISGHTFVSPEGQAGPWQAAAYDDTFVPGLSRMAEAAHEGGSRIALQLAHAGFQAMTSLTHREAVGPSTWTSKHDVIGREMTCDEVKETMRAFVDAAARAKDAGFDAVQLHAAHGYLLSQFLSPYFNRRTDEYGGSVENRARIVLEVLEGIKASLGDGFPVLIKMNSDDYIDGGLTVDEMLRIAQMLGDSGIDGIELSGGTVDETSQYIPVRIRTPKTEEQEAYYREAAKRFKERVAVPLILVGGIRSFTVAQRLIEDGTADFIALSRPLIREPHLIARWKSGNIEKSACGSCNLCFKPIREGKGMYCYVEAKQREGKSTEAECRFREHEDPWRNQR